MKQFLFLLLILVVIQQVVSQTFDVTIYDPLTSDGSCGGTSLLMTQIEADVDCIDIAAQLGVPLASASIETVSPGQFQLVTHLDGTCGGTLPTTVAFSSNNVCLGLVGTVDIAIGDPSMGMGGSDPHFYPLSTNKTIRKMSFTPKAKKQGIYNIFSTKEIQINSLFRFYDDVPVVMQTPQFLGGFYFMIKNPKENSQVAKLSFQQISDKTKSKFLWISLLTNQEIENNQTKSNFSPKFTKSLHKVPFSVVANKFFLFGKTQPEYYVSFPNKWTFFVNTPDVRFMGESSFLELSLRSGLTEKEKRQASAFPKYQWPFLNFDVDVDHSKDMEKAHGILGQTMRADCPYITPPTDGCLACFMKGTTEDYRVSSRFGLDFKYNQYN